MFYTATDELPLASKQIEEIVTTSMISDLIESVNWILMHSAWTGKTWSLSNYNWVLNNELKLFSYVKSKIEVIIELWNLSTLFNREYFVLSGFKVDRSTDTGHSNRTKIKPPLPLQVWKMRSGLTPRDKTIELSLKSKMVLCLGG